MTIAILRVAAMFAAGLPFKTTRSATLPWAITPRESACSSWAPRRPAAARGFPRCDCPGQGRRPCRLERQSRGEHRRYAQYRDGHDPGPGDPARFPEGHMEMRSALRLLFLLLVTACDRGAPARRSAGAYDLILKGGWI